MTSTDIISGFINMVLIHRRKNRVFPNTFIGSWECDILELTKAGYLYEYEVKVSKRDFMADQEKVADGKTKFESIRSGARINYFYYVVPEGLVFQDEVPPFAGLIYVKRISYGSKTSRFKGITQRHEFKIIKKAPLLSKEKASEQMKIQLLESIYHRYHRRYRKEKDREKPEILVYDNKL